MAAGCWLILMLLIHGVKLLHNHSNRIDIIACNAESHAAHNCIVLSEDHSGEDCSSCEYKFCTDADDITVNFLTPVYFTRNYNVSLFAQPDFLFLSLADNKDPPANT
jgi:hypothetical protein